MIFKTEKKLIISPTQNLYKWAKVFNRLQRKFFDGEFELRRERQIHDFLLLNEFKNVHYITDTDVFVGAKSVGIEQADIVVITDQKFSRYPCPTIIKNIEQLVKQCPLYLCLNRHYINLDNSYHNYTLDENFPTAITQWLKQSLDATIIDLSLNYIDHGDAFTWAIPDRHYYICQN